MPQNLRQSRNNSDLVWKRSVEQVLHIHTSQTSSQRMTNLRFVVQNTKTNKQTRLMIILWRKGDSENRYLILLWREGIYLLDLLGDFRTSTLPPAGTTNPAHLPWAVGSLEEWLRDTKFRNHVNPRDVSKTPQWDFWMLKGTPVHPLLHESCLWQHISTGWYRRCLFLKEVPVKRKKGKGTPPHTRF